MSRKGQSKPRIVNPDTLYNSVLVSKIINYCMMHGKKTAATDEIYEAIEILKKETKSDDVIITLEQAIDNIKPKVEVRPRRIGGAVYQVPTAVRGNRQISLAIRWLITSARSLPNKQFHSFGKKVASELLAALDNSGASVTKRQEVERMAEANKAFAHLRW